MDCLTQAPYAPDTRAKGWRFELDHERIRQSDTWALATPEARPWLLMLWMVAWEQTPCGSLPDDDQLIAARIGMPPKAYAKHRELLRRGWWRADDGRLYHDTIVVRVVAMLEKRMKDARRTADKRERAAESRNSHDGVTRDKRVTSDGVGSEFDTKHQAPSTITSSPSAQKVARKRADPTPDCPEGVDPQVWSDWLALRKAKRAPVSATVLRSAMEESVKAGMSLGAFLRVWCARGSQGLEAAWLKPNERGSAGSVEPEWRREQRQRNEAFLGPAAAKRSAEIIDMEQGVKQIG